jgi:Domain of unknown function (DUF4145)
MKYIAPEVFAKSFTCPYCGAIAQQGWWAIDWNATQYPGYKMEENAIRIGTCTHCGEHSIWVMEKMCFPDTGSAPFPNPEMPEDVKKLYLEAASISAKSPRGAAALLRLSVQVLCVKLGEKGDNINYDIKELVAKGLPEIVQQSLDIVRVTGNNAVHPGQIDTDDPAIVAKLFDLVNIIVEYMIALPKRVSGLYSSLPANTVNSIQKRDGA